MGYGPPPIVALSLTWSGHELLDSIRQDSTWAYVKRTAIQKGVDLTFDAVISLAIAAIAGPSSRRWRRFCRGRWDASAKQSKGFGASYTGAPIHPTLDPASIDQARPGSPERRGAPLPAGSPPQVGQWRCPQRPTPLPARCPPMSAPPAPCPYPGGTLPSPARHLIPYPTHHEARSSPRIWRRSNSSGDPPCMRNSTSS